MVMAVLAIPPTPHHLKEIMVVTGRHHLINAVVVVVALLL
jgi:hypothetical protein